MRLSGQRLQGAGLRHRVLANSHMCDRSLCGVDSVVLKLGQRLARLL